MMYDDISRKQKQLGSNEQLCISKTSREKTKIQIIRKNPLSNIYNPGGPQDDWFLRLEISKKHSLLDGCYHSVKVLKVFSNSNIYIGPRQFLTQRTRHASVAQLCTRGLFTSTDSSACSWKAFATGESYSIIPLTAISVLFVFEGEMDVSQMLFLLTSSQKCGQSGETKLSRWPRFSWNCTPCTFQKSAITAYCNQSREMGTWFIWHFYGRTTLNIL